MKRASKMQTLETRIPPPLVTVAAVGVMWLTIRWTPALTLANPARLWPGFVLILIGVLVSVAGVREFKRHASTIDPRNPRDASALVTTGVYRYSRNPMYLGIATALCGVAWYLSNPLALMGVAAFVVYITVFQIRPEERALVKRFGGSGAAYMRRVRRWI